MSEATERGITDHRIVHGLELSVKRLRAAGVREETAVKLATAAVLHDEARRWWERRGYTFPSTDRSDDGQEA
jgi:hypothetical protein